jgi:hypothetical protein
VVFPKTAKTAFEASEYADIRGCTTIAWGQSRYASPPFIAVRTPSRLAS